MNKVTLNPRDAFYGGRTENIAAYYKVERAENIVLKNSRNSERRITVSLAFRVCSQKAYICNTWYVVQDGYKFRKSVSKLKNNRQEKFANILLNFC